MINFRFLRLFPHILKPLLGLLTQSMSCEAALKSEKNIPQSGSHLEFRPCQSPGIEIVGEGIVSREYNPPPRQLNRGSFRIGLNPSLSPIGVYIKNQNLII
jgi:hypothetical protein